MIMIIILSDHQVVRLLAGMKADEEIWNPHVARLFFCCIICVLCLFIYLFVYAQSPHRQLPTHMLPRCCISQKVAHVLDIPNAERFPIEFDDI